jgi:hypothetical protein
VCAALARLQDGGDEGGWQERKWVMQVADGARHVVRTGSGVGIP